MKFISENFIFCVNLLFRLNNKNDIEVLLYEECQNIRYFSTSHKIFKDDAESNIIIAPVVGMQFFVQKY